MIKVETRGLDELRRRLASVAKNVPQAERRVIASAKRSTETFSVRAITDVYTVSKKRARAGFTKGRVKAGELAFVIAGSKRTIGWHHFDVRTPKRGVSVRIKKGGGRKLVPNAFAARTKNFTGSGAGGATFSETTSVRIFVRDSYKRLPIHMKFGPSVADMLVNSIANAKIAEFGVTKLRTELERQIAVALRG